MLRNYIITSFRYYLRNINYTLLNILGLSIGISVFIALALYIQFELSFDNFHTNKESIFRVEQLMIEGGREELMESCPTLLGPALKDEFPEIEYMSRVFVTGVYSPFEIQYGENSFVIKAYYVDQDFLDMFSFPLIESSNETPLAEPLQIILTKSLAKQIFGDENPIGKTLTDDDDLFTVSGIMEDVPGNSHMQFRALCSMSTFKELYGDDVFSWWDNWISVYIKLKENTDANLMKDKTQHILKKFWREDTENQILLRKMTDIHLYSEISDDFALVGSIKNVYIFSIVALIILIMAGVNYTNLSTAQTIKRTKEAGIRKINGAKKGHLIRQLLVESTIITLFALFLAFVIFETFLPWFNNIVQRELNFEYFNNYPLSLLIIIVALLLGSLSSLYPSYLISNFEPLTIIKGFTNKSGKKPVLRKILITVQFLMSVSLIIVTLGVLRQVNFMQNKDLGYNQNDLIRIEYSDTSMNRIKYFREELLKNPNFIGGTIHDYPISSSTNWTRISWEGAEDQERIRMSVNYVDYRFLNIYNMKLIDGKGFTAPQIGNSPEGNQVVINETAVNKMGMKDPIGKMILYGGDYHGGISGNQATIVGVLKDFHFLSVHNTITPIMVRKFNEFQVGQSISIKMTGKNKSQNLQLLQDKFIEIFPEQVFKYHFVEDYHNKMYEEDKKLSNVIMYLAVLAILIACLGVFGLVSFTTAQRTKEIGIRKVLGSSIRNINWIFSKEFILLIILSFIISTPISYIWIKSWLQSYPYKVEFAIWPYLFALFLTMLITMLTILAKTLKTGRVNPADCLRYE